MKVHNITERVAELRQYYDGVLDDLLIEISTKSGVPVSKLKKINPVDFIEKSAYQQIDDYEFQSIRNWISNNKTDDNYLISPLDDATKTAAQISYKEKINTIRIRASKCDVLPLDNRTVLDFYTRNHRQTLPVLRSGAISFGLVFDGLLVGAMTYDKSNSAVRGSSKASKFELMRLAFARGYSIAGGASRLQKYCEEALRHYGSHKIFSYSNATINSGKVYEALGFVSKKIEGGQPFVMLENNRIIRLISLFPNSTDKSLAAYGRIKTHIGGNRLWEKDI